jgi:hypothetical protein
MGSSASLVQHQELVDSCQWSEGKNTGNVKERTVQLTVEMEREERNRDVQGKIVATSSSKPSSPAATNGPRAPTPGGVAKHAQQRMVFVVYEKSRQVVYVCEHCDSTTRSSRIPFDLCQQCV